jgi:hypothetical protein
MKVYCMQAHLGTLESHQNIDVQGVFIVQFEGSRKCARGFAGPEPKFWFPEGGPQCLQAQWSRALPELLHREKAPGNVGVAKDACCWGSTSVAWMGRLLESSSLPFWGLRPLGVKALEASCEKHVLQFRGFESPESVSRYFGLLALRNLQSSSSNKSLWFMLCFAPVRAILEGEKMCLLYH